jgi:hypothetical protein
MVVWELAKTHEYLNPPTKDTIERERLRQLEAIKAIRRVLMERLVVAR